MDEFRLSPAAERDLEASWKWMRHVIFKQSDRPPFT
jgi:hypothetical protein